MRLEANAEGARRSPRDVRLRKGTDGDLSAIRASVLSEGMNPLGLDPSRFVVAVIAALAFVTSGVLQLAIEGAKPNTISFTLQLPQYVGISIAEVLISVTSLSFCYDQATPALKSTISSLKLATVSIGDLCSQFQ